MAIEPDTTDWTWVLERACPQCGLAASDLSVPAVTALVRDAPGLWRGVLARADAVVRPDESTWAPLEYAAHVRDVLRVFDGRFAAMLGGGAGSGGDGAPVFDDWNQDAAALAGRYRELAPAPVADELAQAADALAARLEAVPDAALTRTGRRSDGRVFTVTTLARYLAHELVHHAWDARAR